jgi:uncharacterized membrane protein YraQ (UPF0718 family)
LANATQTWVYLKIVWPALPFGVLISAGVYATISPQPLAKLFGEGEIKPQFAAAAAGALGRCCPASPIIL